MALYTDHNKLKFIRKWRRLSRQAIIFIRPSAKVNKLTALTTKGLKLIVLPSSFSAATWTWVSFGCGVGGRLRHNEVRLASWL